MERSELVWMDGAMVAWDDATVHVSSHGLCYGAGVFEGIRCHETDGGLALFRPVDHIVRLGRSLHVYLAALPYSTTELLAAIKDVVKANGLRDCYVRPLVWLGEGESALAAPLHVAVMCGAWSNYITASGEGGGARVKISSFERIGVNAIPPAAKATGQYLNTFLAKVEALLAGHDEAILLNSAGHVTDGTAENVFVVRDGTLITPPSSDGVLAGITRDSIITIARDLGTKVVEASLVRSDLYLADEVFFTGTAVGVAPVVEIDNRAVGSAQPGPMTMKLSGLYESATRGRTPQYASWLEPVEP